MEVKGLWWAPGHRPRSSSRSKSRPRSGDPLIFSCPGLLFCPWLQTFWRSCTSIIKDTQNSNLEGSQWPNPRAIEGLMPCAVGKPFFWGGGACGGACGAASSCWPALCRTGGPLATKPGQLQPGLKTTPLLWPGIIFFQSGLSVLKPSSPAPSKVGSILGARHLQLQQGPRNSAPAVDWHKKNFSPNGLLLDCPGATKKSLENQILPKTQSIC